jgi:hypothetical protein
VSTPIRSLLLLALPASGKSEIRRYLDHLDPETRRRDLHLGPLVHFDDYPYVHMMRRVSQELRTMGAAPEFFADDLGSLMEPLDWGTLIALLNEDHARPVAAAPGHAGRWLLKRYEEARRRMAVPLPFLNLPDQLRIRLEDAIEAEAADLAALLHTRADGETAVVEFARGGPAGAELPLPAPLGYRYSLNLLAPEILAEAAVLYVWVTPEESRRRNRERARPGRDGDASILHHGVPKYVMEHDYGCDDIAWLLEDSDRPGTIRVETAGGERFHLPAVRFDNRADRTSFLRADPAGWPEERVAELHSRLSAAMDALAESD